MSKIRIIQLLVFIVFQFILSSCSLIFSGVGSIVDSNTTNQIDLSNLYMNQPLMKITLKNKKTFIAYFNDYDNIEKDVYAARYQSFLDLNKTDLPLLNDTIQKNAGLQEYTFLGFEPSGLKVKDIKTNNTSILYFIDFKSIKINKSRVLNKKEIINLVENEHLPMLRKINFSFKDKVYNYYGEEISHAEYFDQSSYSSNFRMFGVIIDLSILAAAAYLYFSITNWKY